MNLKKFFAELKRRNVYKVAVAYAIVGWLVIQISSTVLPTFHTPEWVVQTLVVVVMLGFPIALILAWAFELTPEGLKRTEIADELPKKPVRSRAWIYVVVIAGVISASLFFLGRYTAPNKQGWRADLPGKSLAHEVRVNVQLVKAETDTHLWADTFDRQLTDVFQIESDIAKTIAEKLQTKLTGSEERAISVKPTADLEAHELYLKGRYLWNRRTAESLKKALNYFQQAADKDPNYALAYAGIADTCALFPVYGAGAPQEYLPRAKAAAMKAVELDDSLAEAHASLGLVLVCSFKPAQSAKEFERAIQLNPNYATAHHWYGRLTLLMTGEFDRAMAEAKRAVELDPVSPIIHVDLGTVHLMSKRYDKAIEQYHDTLEMNPEFYFAHRYLGLALELKGDISEAIAEYKRALELNDDPSGLGFIGHAEATAGRQKEAREILAQLTVACPALISSKSIRTSIRCAAIHASKRWWKKLPAKNYEGGHFLLRAQAA